MEALFPFALDKLEKEVSQNKGYHPVFLSGNYDLKNLMNDIKSRDSSLEFTFLVKSHEAKFTLNRLLGEKRIIFTIYESKVIN